MRVALTILTILVATNTFGSGNSVIYIFNQYIELEGNCIFSPFRKTNPAFVCNKNERVDVSYTVAFSEFSKIESVAQQLPLDPETGQQWGMEHLSSNSENVDDLLHVRIVYSSKYGSKTSVQYHVCKKLNCITFTAQSVSEFEDAILQLSSRVISTGKN